MSQAGPARGPDWRGRIGKSLPLAVIWLPLLINAAHVLGFTVWTTWLSFTPSDLLPEYTWAGLRSYRGGGAHREHRDRLHQSRDLRRGLRRPGDARGLRAGGADRPAHPRREPAAHDLPLSARRVVRRHRHGVELAAQSRPRHPEVRAQPRLGRLPLRLDHRPRHGDLHHRHRRRLARRGLRHGAVPGRLALDRSRSRQGRANRRRRPAPLLPAHRPAGHRADRHRRSGHPAAVRHQDLRSRAGADRRRAGHRHHAAGVVVYDFMFQRGQLGRGSAAAVLLLLSLLLVLLPYYAYAQWRARRERARG